MIVKHGLVKILECVHGDTTNGLYNEYNLDVIQKTDGNYNENLVKKNSVFQVQFVQGAEAGRSFTESGNYEIYPNMTLESALNSISNGERTWVTEMTEV